jgi:hypothetical protein
VNDTLENASRELASVIRVLTAEADVKNKLAIKKAGAALLERPDFVWHELLLSFSTMGNSRGAEGLIRTPANYERVTFRSLQKKRSAQSRLDELKTVLHLAKVRMADKKANWLADAFDRIAAAGGPNHVKKDLLARQGRDGKIAFWREFKGIGKKYSRNIMMDVYHPEFRDSIAIDQRIKKISQTLGLRFRPDEYDEEEQFYRGVASRAGVNGWELDRILYSFRDRVIDRLKYRARRKRAA